MTPSKQNIATLLWTMPIVIVCGLKVYLDSILDTCDGLVHGIRDLFLMLILLILSVVFIIKQIYKVSRLTDNKKIPIWAIVIVLVATTIAFQGKATWKEMRLGKSILKASLYPDQLDIGRVELLNGEKYYALYGHIDWSCAYIDKYEIIGDTLILGGDPFGKTDGILTDKYIIIDSTLIPVKTQGREMKRTDIMTIENKN